MKVKTKGASPKVLWDLAISVLSFAITAGLIDIDPATAALISKALGTLAGVIAGPGEVVSVPQTATLETGRGPGRQ